MITICPGDSVLTFGERQAAPDLYTQTFQSLANCDSIVNLRLEYRQLLWFGIGGSTAGAAQVDLGAFIDLGDSNILQIGYGYDHFFQKYGPRFGGGHEISLSYFY